MSVIRTLGAIIRVGARTTIAIVTGLVFVSRVVGRGMLHIRKSGSHGDSGVVRLFDLHAISCVGDTFVVMGFVTTTLTVGRMSETLSEIALYLLIGLVPGVILVVVMGSALDLGGVGHRSILAITMVGRAVAAYMISQFTEGLMLYCAICGIFIFFWVYRIVRYFVLPRFLSTDLPLCDVNARASLFGILSCFLAAPVGLALSYIDGRWPPSIAAGVFVCGGIVAIRLPRSSPAGGTTLAIASGRARFSSLRGKKIFIGRHVLSMLIGCINLRVIYGFLVANIVLAIYSQSQGDYYFSWRPLYVSTFFIAGVFAFGSLLASTIGASFSLRRPHLLQACMTTSVLGVSLATLLSPKPFTIAFVCWITALASGLSRICLNAVIQEKLDESVRSEALTRSEGILILASALGGALGCVFHTSHGAFLFVFLMALLSAVYAIIGAVLLRHERLIGRIRVVAVETGDTTSGTAGKPVIPLTKGEEKTREKTPREKTRRRQPIPAPSLSKESIEILEEGENSSPGFHLYRPSSLKEIDSSE